MGLFFTFLSVGTYAQKKHEFLSEARFFADIEKHFARGPYQIVYSWESNIGFNTLVYRHESHAFSFLLDVQTAGAPPTGRKINIAGTSYTLSPSYIYKFNKNTSFSLGLTHLSSHLSEDVLKILQDQRRKGVIIPPVRFDDINVGFLEIIHSFAFKQFDPSIRFRFQPLGVKFRGGYNFYKEPVFISTQMKIWGNDSKNLLFITLHEFGERSFNDTVLRLDFEKPTRDEEGRLQILFGYSPGSNLRASPNVGWHKEGCSVKMKFVFWAH